MSRFSKTSLFVLGIVVSLLSSCGPRHPLSDLIPGDSLAVIQARDLDSLQKSLQTIIPGTKNSSQILKEWGVEVTWLDQTKPLALALVPEKGTLLSTGNVFSQWIFLPMKNAQDDFKKLQEKLPSTMKSLYEKGYGILILDRAKLPQFPLPGTLDTAYLTLPDQGLIKFYFSPAQAAKAFGSAWTMAGSLMKVGFQYLLTGTDHGSPGFKTWAAKTFGAIVDGLFEVETISGELLSKEDYQFFQFKIAFVENGPASRELKKLKPRPGTLDFAKNLDSGLTAGIVVNLEPGVFNQEITQGFQALHENMIPEFKKNLEEIGSGFNQSMAGRSAISFSLLKDQHLSLTLTQELTQPQIFKASMDKLFKNEFFNFYFPSVVNFSTLPLDLKTNYKDDTLSFEFKVPDISPAVLGNQAPMMENLKRTFGNLNDLLKIKLVYTDSTFKAKLSSVPTAVSGTLDTSKLKALIPDDANMAFFLSPFQNGAIPEAAGYLRFTGSDVHLGLGVETESIKKFFQNWMEIKNDLNF